MSKKEIAHLMKLKGWSQAQFAREIETSEGVVSRWLSGETTPTGPTQKFLRMLYDAALDEAKKQPA